MPESFRRACRCIKILLVVEAILSVIIIGVTGTYHLQLGSFLVESERNVLNGQFFTVYMLGVMLALTYLSSLQMWNFVSQRRDTANIRLLLTMWLFFCFLISVCGCGTVCIMFLYASTVESAVETSLMRGIDLYYSFPEWKLLWDRLQFYRECCGVYSHLDWMKAIWMPSDIMQLSEAGASEVSERDIDDPEARDERQTCIITLAPYACCKHSLNTCFDKYQPHLNGNGIPFLNLTQINTEGCLAIFSVSMWNMLYLLVVLMAVIIHVDIIIFCLTKYIIRKQKNFVQNSDANDDVSSTQFFLKGAAKKPSYTDDDVLPACSYTSVPAKTQTVAVDRLAPTTAAAPLDSNLRCPCCTNLNGIVVH